VSGRSGSQSSGGRPPAHVVGGVDKRAQQLNIELVGGRSGWRGRTTSRRRCGAARHFPDGRSGVRMRRHNTHRANGWTVVGERHVPDARRLPPQSAGRGCHPCGVSLRARHGRPLAAPMRHQWYEKKTRAGMYKTPSRVGAHGRGAIRHGTAPPEGERRARTLTQPAPPLRQRDARPRASAAVGRTHREPSAARRADREGPATAKMKNGDGSGGGDACVDAMGGGPAGAWRGVATQRAGMGRRRAGRGTGAAALGSAAPRTGAFRSGR